MPSEPAPGFTSLDPEPVVAKAPPAEPQRAPIQDPLFAPPPPAPVAEEIPPPPIEETQQSQFAHEPPFKPRRNPAKLWTMAAIAFALVIAAATGALWYWGAPEVSFGSAREPDLKIKPNEGFFDFKPEDNTPFVVASGTITNPSAETQSVPDILVTLKDANGRSVFTFPIKPKVKSLPPGGRTEFSQLRLDVPRAATRTTMSWILDN